MLVDQELVAARGAAGAAVATATTIRPVLLPIPIPRRERETLLTLRDRASNEVVTVIEVLSPSNKRRGSDGQREYREKRDAVLMSPENLVELDLLRGGERLPTLKELPTGDYYAFVHRERQRPMAEVYAWSLREVLPPLPVPLAGDEEDAKLELQAVFATVYERGGYDYALNYAARVDPPVCDADAEWVRERVGGASPATDE
jgi:hypothetical protein